MPWDWFCPECSATLLGGMTDVEEEMVKEWRWYDGKIIYCSHCDKYFSYDTGKPVEIVTIKDWESGKVVYGG